MIKKILLSFVFAIQAGLLFSQTVNHFETVVYDSDEWKYFVGTSDPGTAWMSKTFDDASWSAGVGGFGYGDNDDRTIISATISVFIRKKFDIVDKDVIESGWLHVDYDDGFVAYLNGTEIARSSMGTASPVAYNQASVGLHEAVMYLGGRPEGFPISKETLASLLVEGENVLAIEVHNESIGSSDLSAAAFFSIGINDDSFTYREPPSWFESPFSSSNLPIIVINTNGQTISDEPGIIADMGIIYNGAGVRNNITDPFNNFNGKIEVELRGESSQMFPKKSLKIETRDVSGNNLNAALLGMPPENDWVLYAPYTDKTFLRDVMTFKIGNDMGHYAPRTRFVELVINGDYAGVYVLMERIKVDNNRVDIATLNPDEITGDDITGGYILRVDKIDGNDFPQWASMPSPQLAGAATINLQYFDPKGEDLVSAQQTYIKDFILKVGSSLTSSDFKGVNGYRKYLDVPAAIDFMISNEIGKNVDGYIFSTYMHKNKDSEGGKLVMGPLWDFNLCYGNVDYWTNSQFAPGWMWNDGQRMFWFRRMMADPWFAGQMKCRWTELRSTWMTDEYFTNYIDSVGSALDEAQDRNYKRWPILGTYIWPNQFVGQTYQQELGFLKQWTIERLNWIDANLPGTCEVVTGTEDDLLNSIEIYPNPSNSAFFIELPQNIARERVVIEIYDLIGQRVAIRPVDRNGLIWDGNAASGIYTAVIKIGGRKVQKRIVKY
jgi:hypothetical protein